MAASPSMRLPRWLSDFFSEFPEAVAVSDAYREVTFIVPESNPWNPNTSMSAAPRDFLITMECVRPCTIMFVRYVVRVIADLLLLGNCARSRTQTLEQDGARPMTLSKLFVCVARKMAILGPSAEDHS